MNINTKQELYDYLNNVDMSHKKETKLSSVYFLIEFDGHTEPIYFMPYKDSWFESPCFASKFQLEDDDLIEFVKELYEEESIGEAYMFEKTMQRNGWHYVIDCTQCIPFLPDKIKIVDILSETECLNWLLKNEDI